MYDYNENKYKYFSESTNENDDTQKTQNTYDDEVLMPEEEDDSELF